MGSHRVGHDWSDLAAAAVTYSVLCFNKVDKHLKSPAYVFSSSSPSPLPNGTGFCIYDLLSQVVLVVKNLPANGGDVRTAGLIPGSGDPLEEAGHGNPLQYSCLENPMDRGAWWAIVHGVAKSRTQLKRLSTHTHTWSYPCGYLDSYDLWPHPPTLHNNRCTFLPFHSG